MLVILDCLERYLLAIVAGHFDKVLLRTYYRHIDCKYVFSVCQSIYSFVFCITMVNLLRLEIGPLSIYVQFVLF